MINNAKVEIVMSIYAAVARGKRGSFVRACDVPPSVRPGEIQVVDVDPALRSVPPVFGVLLRYQTETIDSLASAAGASIDEF